MSPGKAQHSCLGLSGLNPLCVSQAVFSCGGKTLSEEEVPGPDEAQHLGQGAGRRGEKRREGSKGQLQCPPVFLHLLNTSDPLIALENLTFRKNEETKIAALPVAWKLWKHGTMMRQSGEGAKAKQNRQWKFYATKG